MTCNQIRLSTQKTVSMCNQVNTQYVKMAGILRLLSIKSTVPCTPVNYACVAQCLTIKIINHKQLLMTAIRCD